MSLITLLLEKGGIVIYPLLFCSVIMLFVVFQKIFALQSRHLIPAKTFDYWKKWLKEKKDEPLTLEPSSALLDQILVPILNRLPMPEEKFTSLLQNQFRHIKNKLERYLIFLETVAGTAPLLGLLGTALGMLGVFSELTKTGARVDALSGNISEALITTVVGLSIGIAALVAFNLINRHIDNLLLETETQINQLFSSKEWNFFEENS